MHQQFPRRAPRTATFLLLAKLAASPVREVGDR
jgi:hypothetical protein